MGVKSKAKRDGKVNSSREIKPKSRADSAFDAKSKGPGVGSPTLREVETKLVKICKGYAKKFEIDCDDDWFLLKLQEEVGELVSAHLKLTKRARPGKKTREEKEQNLREEIADVLAMVMLFANAKGVDVEEALADKWFRYLE